MTNAVLGPHFVSSSPGTKSVFLFMGMTCPHLQDEKDEERNGRVIPSQVLPNSLNVFMYKANNFYLLNPKVNTI